MRVSKKNTRISLCSVGFCSPNGMRMAFPTHAGEWACSTVLIEGWVVDSAGKEVLAFFLCLLAGLVHEYIVFFRISIALSWQTAQPETQQLLLNRR